MLIFEPYDLIIFDCDGVLLDSNNMKVAAMRAALSLSNYFSDTQVEALTSQFKENFGMSRYHHVASFTETLDIDGAEKQKLEEMLLLAYAEQVDKFYLEVPEALGIKSTLSSLKGKLMYVASGSEQEQLRTVLEKRNFSNYFIEVLGSPVSKSQNIKNILNSVIHISAVMVGDALADYEAAKKNNIDFIFYAPLSNVKQSMLELSQKHDFKVIHSFKG